MNINMLLEKEGRVQPGFLLYGCVKTLTKTNLAEKGFICLTGPLEREVKEFKAGTWTRTKTKTMEEGCLLASFLQFDQLPTLHISHPPVQEQHGPMQASPSSINWQSRKCLLHVTTGQGDGGNVKLMNKDRHHRDIKSSPSLSYPYTSQPPKTPQRAGFECGFSSSILYSSLSPLTKDSFHHFLIYRL